MFRALLLFAISGLSVNILMTWHIRTLITSICGFLTAILAVIISEQQWFKKLTIKINNKTFNNNIWEDIIDYKKTVQL